MARFYDPTPEQQKGWDEWVASRPPNVRTVAEKFDPWSLFRMDTGHRCTIASFAEDPDGKVTVTVNITGDHNLTMFDRRVFGIDPATLQPCDLPTADEPVGSVLTEQGDIDAYIDAVRPLVLAGRRDSDLA
jgi:hypothetical protein